MAMSERCPKCNIPLDIAETTKIKNIYLLIFKDLFEGHTLKGDNEKYIEKEGYCTLCGTLKEEIKNYELMRRIGGDDK